MSVNSIITVSRRTRHLNKLKKIINKGYATYHLFPFDVLLGTYNITNTGYLPKNSLVKDSSTFQRIFTGQENINIVWVNSVKVVKSEDVGHENEFEKQFSVGDYIFGTLEDNSTQSIFNTTPQDAQFKEQIIARTYSFLTTSGEISNSNMYQFYVIPELGADTPLRIVDATNYYDSKNKYVYTRLTLKTLIDELNQTGVVNNNYIRFGTVGGNYAFPQVIVNDETGERSIGLDEERLKIQGITHFQIEFLGVVELTSLMLHGVPADEKYVSATRQIYTMADQKPLPDEVVSKSIPSSTFYLFASQNDIVSYYGTWKDNISAQGNVLEKKQYEGSLKLIDDVDDIRKTNLPSGTGNEEPPQPYNSWKINMANIDFTFDMINGYAYDNTRTENPSTVDLGKKTFSMTVLKDNTLYTDSPFLPFHDILFYNHFIFNHIVVLNMDSLQQNVWHLTDIPILGHLVSSILFGANFSWTNAKEDPALRNSTDWGFMDLTTFEAYVTSLYPVTGDNTPPLIPLDAFRSDTLEQVGALISTSSTTTAIAGRINDKILIKSCDGNNVLSENAEWKSTVYLGQEDDTTSNKFYFVRDDNMRLASLEDIATEPLSTPEAKGYVIHAVSYQAKGRCNLTLRFFSGAIQDDLEVARFDLQTQAQLVGSIRMWTGIFLTSFYINSSGQVVAFPKQLAQNKPTNQTLDEVVKIVYNFNYDYSGQFIDKQFIIRIKKPIRVSDWTVVSKIVLTQTNHFYWNNQKPDNTTGILITDIANLPIGSATTATYIYQSISTNGNYLTQSYAIWRESNAADSDILVEYNLNADSVQGINIFRLNGIILDSSIYFPNPSGIKKLKEKQRKNKEKKNIV